MAKSVIKNYFYNLTYQILCIIIPIITTPYIARVLGAENVGIYSYTLSITTYFILFGSLGIAIYAQREIAYVQNNVKKRSKIFWEVVILRCITMVLSGIVFYFTFVRNGEYSIYFKILILEMIANCIDISWFFQGLEEFKKTVLRNIVVKIISIIMIFIFIKSPDDLIKYFIIYVLSTLIGNISLWFYIPKYITKINNKEINITKHIKPTIALFIPQIAIQIYTVLDKTMIGTILNDMTEVGYYEQAQKVIKIIMTIITSLSTVMVPRIAKEFANKNMDKIKKYMMKSFNYILFLSIPMVFGIIAISEAFVPVFFGSGYEKVSIIMNTMSLIIIFIPFSGTIGSQFLVASKRQKELTISVLLGALVNFVLNIILILNLKSVGAGLATVVAELTVTLIQFYFIRDLIKLKDVIKIVPKYLIASILMFIICIIIKCFIKNGLVLLISILIIAPLIYFILLYLMKDEFLLYIIKKIKNKIKRKKVNV